ncbi:RNA chaperone ProQ [Candidatus Hartigia pinicola]|nr:RNA chaperone ProQ [Candidatus Hartigia pinicola]
MENQPKLNTNKNIIILLSERFPRCFIVEGETRPLKIGIFQDIVECLSEKDGISKTQLRSALRMYTSSWRYLYSVKEGAKRIDLHGNVCSVLEKKHVIHARERLINAKSRVQAQHIEKKEKKQPIKKSRDYASTHSFRITKENFSHHNQLKNKERLQHASIKYTHCNDSKALNTEQKLESVTDISTLQIGQILKVKIGKSILDVSVLNISKDGVRVQLPTGIAMIVFAEHLKF